MPEEREPAFGELLRSNLRVVAVGLAAALAAFGAWRLYVWLLG